MAPRKKATRRGKAASQRGRRFRLRAPAIVRDNPLDSAGLAFAGVAALAIMLNALVLQGGRGTLTNVVPAPKPALTGTAAPGQMNADGTAAPSMLVREVQAELSRRGLYNGPTDGIFGPRTEAAILDFEIGAGLKPTGKPNPTLLAAMRGGGAPAIVPTSRVAAVQRELQRRGFGPAEVDGILGESTRAAIRRFEASRRLPQRGEITPALLKELSKSSSFSAE